MVKCEKKRRTVEKSREIVRLDDCFGCFGWLVCCVWASWGVEWLVGFFFYCCS